MKKLVVVLIITLAAVLRFYNLTSMPVLNADEASIGYNAYSLLETGKDEHGHSWPVHFQSFNDYKPGLYFYLVMPFVKVLGLNELAVRSPGAIMGVFSILVLWLIVGKLFPEKKWLPELSALFLAISSWHLQFSRGGWEVNAATFFILCGVYFFLSINKRSWSLLLSIIFFIASLYTYHAARIISPLLFLCLFGLNWKSLISKKKLLILSCLVGLVLLIPLGKDLLSGAGVSRAAGVGLFADLGPTSKTNEQRGDHADYQGLLPKIIHNRPINYSLAFVSNYLKHFSGEFLFISGDDIQRDKVPEMGQMYLLDLLFIFIGLIAIARQSKGWGVIIFWLVIAAIPASLTFQSPHALRAENMVIPLVTISAYGALSLVGLLKSWIKNCFLLFVFCFLLFIFYSWDFSRYLHQYYYHMEKTYDYSSQYGAKDLVSYIQENYNNYSHFIITTRYDQPYILFLFYTKYSPQKFRDGHILTARDSFGFSTVPSYDKYIFTEIDNLERTKEQYPNSLIVIAPDETLNQPGFKTIDFPSGRPAYIMIQNK